MRSRLVFAGLLLAAQTVSAQRQVTPPDVEPDPRFKVELIVFAYNAGNPGEEDFLHGISDYVSGPKPHLFELPPITLESVADLVAAEQQQRFGRPAFSPLPEATSEPAESGDPAADDGNAPSDATAAPDSALDPNGALFGDATLAPPPLTDALELFEREFRTDTPPPLAARALPDGFQLAPPSEYELVTERRQLDRLGAYSVLGHAAWYQSGVDTDRSVAIDLAMLGIGNPRGTIEVYLRRFLHAIVDFDFYRGDGTFWTHAAPGFGLAPFIYAESFKLAEERNAIRVGELHGFDHPLYGVLLQITRAPLPEAEEQTGGTAGSPAG